MYPSDIKNNRGKYCSKECYYKSKEKEKIILICKECGEKFEVFPSVVKYHNGKYCSKECYSKSREKKEIRICEYCNKEFKRPKPSIIKNGWGRFCSKTCYDKSQLKRIVRKCKFCGEEFETFPSKINDGGGKYCSKECCSNDLVGSNHPNWVGGPKEYCEKFNNAFKRRVLAFWYINNKNICPICEKPIIDETPHCHHVYYDKKSCCLKDLEGIYFSNLGISSNEKTFEIIGDPDKFSPLHGNCHAKTTKNGEREFYARKIETLINEKFNGKSYFTEDEYKEFLIYHPDWKIPYKYYNKKK